VDLTTEAENMLAKFETIRLTFTQYYTEKVSSINLPSSVIASAYCSEVVIGTRMSKMNFACFPAPWFKNIVVKLKRADFSKDL